VKPPFDVERFKPLTIEFDFKRVGYATTTRHGHSVDARLYKPIPSLADISEGESFKVFVEKNKRAILLIRGSELDTPEKVQDVFRSFAAHGLTSGLVGQIARGARKANAVAIRQTVGRRKYHVKVIGGHRKRKS
jgi:hypothetical protein